MKRLKIKTKDLIRNAVKELPDIYGEGLITQICETAYKVLVDAYLEGNVVNFGIGNTYIKLRNNNANFSPRPDKTTSFVFRGDIDTETASKLREITQDEEIKEMFYSRRGSDKTFPSKD